MPPAEVARFEHHLSLCEGCVFYVEQIRMTIEAVGRIGEEDVPPEIRDGARRRVPGLQQPAATGLSDERLSRTSRV